MSDRKTIKQNAKQLCRTAKPSLIAMGLIFTLISAVISALSTSVLGNGVPRDAVDRFMYSYSTGNYEKALSFVAELQPSPASSLISLLLKIVLWIVTAGFVIFIMNSVRRKEPAYANILDGFGLTLRVIGLNILEGIVIALMSCLLVVPGIIFGYAYRQAMYIMIDHPEKPVLQCMKESRRMMRGHKWELFVMDLSFLGWLLLAAILPVLGIYVAPLTESAYFMFYLELTGEPVPEPELM